ncbi:ribosome biogenesis protein ytm1 [Allomyces arbusculus]|nr:ribosome biogenesis protein ytm1 [Allomyces arbusculus]
MAHVSVKFTTAQRDLAVPPAAIRIPATFKRAALAEVVNHLLGRTENPLPLDFLIDGTLLRSSLAAYLESHGLSAENELVLEYLVALPPPTPVAAFHADDWISAVAIPSKDRVVSAGYDGVVRVWDTTDGKTVSKHQVAAGVVPLKAALILPSEEDAAVLRVAVAGMDQKVTIVDMPTDTDNEAMAPPRPICELAGHTGAIEALAHVPDLDQLFTASWDGSIKVFSTKSGDLTSAAAPPAAKKARRTANTTPSTPSLPTIPALGSMYGHHGAVTALSCDPTTRTLFSGGHDHGVRVWDLATHTTVQTMTCEKAVLALAYSPTSRLLASGHADPVVRLWDVRAKDSTLVRSRLAAHKNQVVSVAWAPNSAWLLSSASLDGTVKVLDVRSPGQPLHVVAPAVQVPKWVGKDGEKAPVAKRLCVAWGEGMVAAGGEDCELQVWRAEESM